MGVEAEWSYMPVLMMGLIRMITVASSPSVPCIFPFNMSFVSLKQVLILNCPIYDQIFCVLGKLLVQLKPRNIAHTRFR